MTTPFQEEAARKQAVYEAQRRERSEMVRKHYEEKFKEAKK